MFAFTASALVPIGAASKSATLTFRSGAVAVGKLAISDAAGSLTSKVILESTGNRAASMLAGMAASTVTGFGLNALDSKYSISTGDSSGESGTVATHNDTCKFDIEKIKPELKTEKDTAFFWSGKTDGIGGSDVAMEIAQEYGGVTLESTIETKGISMPEWDFNDSSSLEAWNSASLAYAEQASGEVRAVIGTNLRTGNIWENIELPALINNPNVSKITTIDPNTRIETIIFRR